MNNRNRKKNKSSNQNYFKKIEMPNAHKLNHNK